VTGLPDVSQAVILAAGRGTRLGELTADRPKPLLTIGRRPLIAHILDGLIGAGVEEVTVVTGYHASMIEAELGNGAGSGVSIRYARQEQPDGTARALALAREHLGGQRFMFAWGDILVHPQNYRAVVRASRLADGAIAVNPVDDPATGAAVMTEPPLPWPPTDDMPGAIVTGVLEKPGPGSGEHWNNAGFGVLGPEIWPAIDALRPSPRGEFELPAAIDAVVRGGLGIRAVPVEGPWFDIGTPDNLEAARAAFTT
jgi:NDP-sugar pyrophosphorylase family protein